MTYKPIEHLKPQGKKAVELMRSRGMRVKALNIVYFEGINTDLATLNDDRLNGWNDVRCIITDDGDVLMAAQATTEPGRHYTVNPMNPKGAFRIQLNTQFRDAWKIDYHYDQWALVQCAPVTGHRDLNQDGYRTNDKLDTGYFGINQHTTSDAPDGIGRWSAGCLVGRFASTHNLFMRICHDSGMDLFDTVVFDGKLLLS